MLFDGGAAVRRLGRGGEGPDLMTYGETRSGPTSTGSGELNSTDTKRTSYESQPGGGRREDPVGKFGPSGLSGGSSGFCS